MKRVELAKNRLRFSDPGTTKTREERIVAALERYARRAPNKSQTDAGDRSEQPSEMPRHGTSAGDRLPRDRAAMGPVAGEGSFEVTMKKKNHRADASRSAEPPEEIGTNLVSIVRGDDILRATWTTYEGHPYLSLRIWTPARDGPGYWPTRRGVSIRRHELADIRDALEAAIQLAERFEGDAA